MCSIDLLAATNTFPANPPNYFSPTASMFSEKDPVGQRDQDMAKVDTDWSKQIN